VPACLLVARQLPPPNAWTALLDGRFAPEHWLAIGAAPAASAEAEVDA